MISRAGIYQGDRCTDVAWFTLIVSGAACLGTSVRDARAGFHSMSQRKQLSASCLLAQYKDRVRLDLIKPAVDWRKTGSKDASAAAAVARA